ncbi:hypothetical protein ACI2KG_00380 [Pseudomonas sp. NPDC089407]|uniref:hypothetical protein n=1 Tax=Pseudomonas sp. NPDC089407 TaxID=3364464 RepID=UPI00384CA1DA
MAASKCIKCDSPRFEIKKANITGANFIMYFIQCAGCGGVVGVVEAENIGAKLEKISRKIGAL